MHGCGSGRRVSSARMAVSSRRRASSFSAASPSRGRLVELRHICWARQCQCRGRVPRWSGIGRGEGERASRWRGLGGRDSVEGTLGGARGGTYEEAAVLSLEPMEALRRVSGGGVFPRRARREGGVAQEARPLFSVSPASCVASKGGEARGVCGRRTKSMVALDASPSYRGVWRCWMRGRGGSR